MSKRVFARQFFLSLLMGASVFAGAPKAHAADYPPAFNYDTLLRGLEVSDKDASMPFASRISNFEIFVPGRDVKGKISIVDAEGKIVSSREYVYEHKNGQAVGRWNNDTLKCPTCLKGPGRFNLKPGVYWLVFSEDNQVFSSEWFEVRSYPLGQGRFSAGDRYYLYAPASQMARLNTKNGDFRAEVGLAGEKRLGKEHSISVPFYAVLKQNGKEIARTPGKDKKAPLYPQTTLQTVFFTRPNYKPIKAKDLTDGKYQIDVFLDNKAVRRFDFIVKGGAIQAMGRQLESIKPAHRMIVSENGTWLWNQFAKAPERQLPDIDWSSDPSKPFGFSL